MDLEEQLHIIRGLQIRSDAQECFKHIGFSVGIKPESKEAVKRFTNLGVKIICIDVAHGDSKNCIDMTSWIKNNYPDVLLISGNTATGEGTYRLWEAGADMVRIGVGNGSICSTRLETGNGVPLLTSLIEAYEVKKEFKQRYNRDVYIISDGGCSKVGDICKSLCFSDMIMSGNLFSGCMETPGTTVTIDGHVYKEYVGSSTHGSSHIE